MHMRITGADAARDARSWWRADGLGRRLETAEAVVFQGRQAELDAVLATLDTPDRLPGVVSLTGPPGIGKTAFVYALERACGDRDAADVAIIDSRDFPHTLPGLFDVVRVASARAIQRRAVAGPARPLLLVFDTFEEMRDLEEQFWGRAFQASNSIWVRVRSTDGSRGWRPPKSARRTTVSSTSGAEQ